MIAYPQLGIEGRSVIYIRTVLVAVVAFVVATAALSVEPITKTIPANTSSYITGMATYDKLSCRGGATPKLGR